MNLARPLLVLSLWLASCTGLPEQPMQPEQATASARAWQAAPVPSPVFARHAVAAAHPLAADAALQMLRAGGSAVDAAIAAQLVLGLVEPQSSGIGGGAFLLVHDGARLDAWDGRETAPAAINERWFLDADGRPLPFSQAVVGGRSVGVPGVLRMLEAAHRAHGRLAWAQLFEPAIRLASAGYPVSPRLAAQLAGDPALHRDPVARQFYFDPQARPLLAGTQLRNPDLAWVLQAVAAGGADAFYTGAVAQAMSQAVRHHPVQRGVMTPEDLAAYRPVRREALCLPWRAWRLCGMPPPSGGLITVGQVLQLLDVLDATTGIDTSSDDALHRLAEAGRLALADRDAYIADPAFVHLPGGGAALLSPTYLQPRARHIGPSAAPQVTPGQPWPQPSRPVADASHEIPATSHLSIVDERGQTVAMTTSIEAQFGARVMVNTGHGTGGFLLNNQLTDFSFVPEREGQPVANRVQPGKRPRSSMTPLLVLRPADSRVEATLGAPGGPFIPFYVLKTLRGVYLQGLPPQQAVDAPNAGVAHTASGTALVLETGGWPASVRAALTSRGHRVTEAELPSGIQLLMRRADGRWTGAADRRREGVVVGD